MAQVQQFIRSLAFANPQQQEQLLQRVPIQKRGQVLMRAQQIRQQMQQQQQQQNVGGMGIGQSQGGMGMGHQPGLNVLPNLQQQQNISGMGQSQPGMNVLPGQQPQQQHQMGSPGNMASFSVGSVQQVGGGVTVTTSGGQVKEFMIVDGVVVFCYIKVL